MNVLTLRRSRERPTAVRVEPMRRRDLTDVMRIESSAHPRPWSVDVMRAELERSSRGERDYVVARCGRAVQGFGGLMYTPDEAHVTNIAVAPEWRGHGLGRRLLAELSWITIGRGLDALTLEVRASNEVAQSLYRRFGFESEGVRVRYYENVEDAVVMWCRGLQRAATIDRLRRLAPEVGR